MGEVMEERDRLERWCDKHNHKMGLIRTIGGVVVFILQVVILYKVSR